MRFGELIAGMFPNLLANHTETVDESCSIGEPVWTKNDELRMWCLGGRRSYKLPQDYVLKILGKMNPGSTTDEDGFVLRLSSNVLILPKGRDGKRWGYYLRNGKLNSANGVFKILSSNGAPFNGEIREEVIRDA